MQSANFFTDAEMVECPDSLPTSTAAVLLLSIGVVHLITCSPAADHDAGPLTEPPRATAELFPRSAPVATRPPGSGPGHGVRFVDVTAASGVDFRHVSGDEEQRFIIESMGSGAAFFDYDADGYLDLYLVNGTRTDEPPTEAVSRLYGNEPDGSGGRRFVDVTPTAGVGGRGWGMGCAVADYDNDANVDLYVTYWGENILYRNDGGGGFTDVTREAGVGDDGWSASAAFGDLDADGFLDLYVANYLEFDLETPPNEGKPCLGFRGVEGFCGPNGLPARPDVLFRNRRDGRFEDVSHSTGIDRHVLPGLGVVFADFDDDGDQDIYVANDGFPNLLWRNDGGWSVSEVGATAGVAYSEEGRAQAGMGVDSGDYDNDGDLDFFVTNFSNDVNTLYRNEGEGVFSDATAAGGLGGLARPYMGWSTAFFDADNNGWVDLFVANGHLYPQLDIQSKSMRYAQRNLLYWNEGGTFVPAGPAVGSDLQVEKVSRGGAFGDYDNDGDMDIVVVNLNDAPTFLRNEGGNTRSWLGLELEGEISNRDGIGARVRLTSGGRTQTAEVRSAYGYLSSHDRRLLFGLGDRDRVDRVEITWPSGRVQLLENPGVRQYVKLREGRDEPLVTYAAIRSDETSVKEEAAKLDAASGGGRPGEPATSGTRLPPVQLPGIEGATAEELFLRGVELYESADDHEAAALFREVLRRQPDYLESYYSLAVVLYGRLGRSLEALQVLEEGAARDSSHAPIYDLQGTIWLSLDRPDRAIAALERAIALAPNEWKTHNRLGIAQLRKGNLQLAAKAFQAAVAAATYAPAPHAYLARVYERMGRQQAASRERQLFERWRPVQDRIHRYEDLLRGQVDDVEINFALAGQYLLQGRGAEAEKAIERVVESRPAFARAHYLLGGALQNQGKLDRAIDAYGKAYAIDTSLVTALNDMGFAQHQAGRLGEAISTYEKVVSLRPSLALAHLNLGMAYAHQGRRKEAIAALRTAVKEDSTLALAHRALRQLQVSER